MKRARFTSVVLMLTALFLTPALYSQEIARIDSVAQVTDSVSGRKYLMLTQRESRKIKLEKEDALKYLMSKYRSGDWSNPSDPLRKAIGELIQYATLQPFDTVNRFLSQYNYDSVNIPWHRFYAWDSVKMRVPVNIQPELNIPADTAAKSDTLREAVSEDTTRAANLDLQRDSISIIRPVQPVQNVVFRDTVLYVAVDTLTEFLPYKEALPFWVYRYPNQGDSIYAAIKALANYLIEKDSSVVHFKGISGAAVPVWLNSKTGRVLRYWLRNEYSDSVTVWLGSSGRNTIGIFLEEGITFRRPVKQTTISDARLNLKQVDNARLQDVNKIYVKPDYWKVRSEAAFVLNQTFLTNWVKGGESSISTAMDLTGYADYNNKQAKLMSVNFARLKYGLVKSGDTKIRKNLDLLETNSKLSHKAFGKFDISAILLFKTQLSKGYSYSKVNDRDTAILISKFMSPATLTVGLGLDYKPNKKTSITFSPLSYKGTFVSDTTGIIGINAIDPTRYGIEKGKKSLNEPGVSLQFTNEMKPFKTLTVTNRVQLFTNYIRKPQNVDIDWEMIATANLNWFTDVRINTHLIFDDDTRTTVLDKDGKPVLGPDSKPKKTARIQFKELIGFSFVFRF
jgi:hypothetical protein